MQIDNKAISFREIILKGQLKSLKIGSSVMDLRVVLGEPEDKSFGIKNLIIEKYHEGSLEITIQKKLIILIAIYFNKGTLKKRINLEKYNFDLPPEVFTNFISFVIWLDASNLLYKTRKDDIGYEIIELEHGVTIIFYQNSLYSIQTNLQS